MLKFVLSMLINKMMKDSNKRKNLDWIICMLHDALHENCQEMNNIDRDGLILSSLDNAMDYSIEEVIEHKNAIVKKLTDS